MEELVPETKDILYIQHIHSTGRMEVDPNALPPGLGDDNDDEAFPKLYHAESAPCSMVSASTASWCPCRT